MKPLFLKCDECGVVIHETDDSRHESDKCGIAYSSPVSPGQFYPCEGRLVEVSTNADITRMSANGDIAKRSKR